MNMIDERDLRDIFKHKHYLGEKRHREGLRNIPARLTLREAAGGGDGQSLFSNPAVVTVTRGR